MELNVDVIGKGVAKVGVEGEHNSDCPLKFAQIFRVSALTKYEGSEEAEEDMIRDWNLRYLDD